MQPATLPEMLLIEDRTRTCLIDGRKTLTYGELDSQSSDVAALLESLGVRKGDRVVLFLPNCWQFVVAMYGILKLGAICVPLDFRSTEREVQFFSQNSKSSISIVSVSKSGYLTGRKIEVEPESAEKITPASSTHPTGTLRSEDPALLLYTGGTTGFPKGVVLTHRNVLHVLSGLSKAWQLREDREVFAQFLPMTHSGGLNCNLNSALFSGGATVIMHRFDSTELLNLVEKHGVTAFSGVPTVYNSLIRAPELNTRNLSSLRLCFSSGAALSPETANTFKEKTGITINVGWGLTEASPQLAVAPLGVFKQSYVGIPLDETEIVALDESHRPLPSGQTGELAAKGPQVMSGYFENAEETSKVFTSDGWLLTGDLGYVGSDGVYLLGRKKEAINTGGYKVWPSEVESLLLENEHVLEAAVVGISDDYYGETVKAFVVSKSPVSEEELTRFCRARLSSYKVPRKIEFRTSLPKSSVGKILRRALQEESKSSND
ncbi:MAG: AMP-binding protein [Nitrososphaerota archaeon]|nr:AMP-binding protein [Nitrososphaerota archaeon]